MYLRLLYLGVVAEALQLRPPRSQTNGLRIQSQGMYWLGGSRPKEIFTLPIHDIDPSTRAFEINQKRHGYLYGPSLLGNTSYFPTGFLGDAMVQQHQHDWYSDSGEVVNAVAEESVVTAAALETSGGLHTLADFEILYKGQWKRSNPLGVSLGGISNATQDLLFSMERLSANPYTVRRLHPTIDELPFIVDPAIVTNITGEDLETLHKGGYLFFVDHKYQANYPVLPGRYTAACSAYFYINPISGDFLPLAIKTNVGADLIYTPLDEEMDWLLAKAMFNVNDLFHGQIFHLANSHAVAEIVHQAALRTLSDRHPVSALLHRLMHQAYAIRPVGKDVLFNPGGFFEQNFAISNEGVRMFATEFYHRVAGPFQSNYFHANLVKRGLLKSTYGPELKAFPFYEDANIIHASIRRFITAFVQTYYTSDHLLSLDHELQSWVREATNEALVIDFPAALLVEKSTLIDILTHIAFLTGVSHHVLNSGSPVAVSALLPLHPAALYAPLPEQKGVKDIMPFLPPGNKSIEHVALFARFNRPRLHARRESLAYMFSSDEFLDRNGDGVRDAAAAFHAEMLAFSNRIGARGFDSQGLSQGMPIVWRVLDPTQIPFFLNI